MKRRPFPVLPRGPGRRRARDQDVIIGVPRDCPMWKMQAMRALFKPQLKDAILHRTSTQKWASRDRAVITDALHGLRERLQSYDEVFPDVHFPRAGEYWMIATCARTQEVLARTIAIVLSRNLPKRWIVVGRLMVRNEKFYRRTGRFNLVLKGARHVHLTRAMRAVIGNRRYEKSPDRS